jgi:hypothetical protein
LHVKCLKNEEEEGYEDDDDAESGLYS